MPCTGQNWSSFRYCTHSHSCLRPPAFACLHFDIIHSVRVYAAEVLSAAILRESGKVTLTEASRNDLKRRLCKSGFPNFGSMAVLFRILILDEQAIHCEVFQYGSKISQDHLSRPKLATTESVGLSFECQQITCVRRIPSSCWTWAAAQVKTNTDAAAVRMPAENLVVIARSQRSMN